MCAAMSRERWQRNTHTHIQTCFAAKKKERKKQKTNLTCNNNSRHATPFRMSYDRLLSSLSADYDAMRLCSACHLPHMPHAAWLHDCMPHTACQMCRIAPPPPSYSCFSSFCDANVNRRRCCNLRISNCCWPPADFCHCVACPAKGTLHSGGTVAGGVVSLSGNCYCYCCYLCCHRFCCWCSMKCAMRLYCQ